MTSSNKALFSARFSMLTMMIVIACFASRNVSAEEYKVGGDEGWHEPSANDSETYSKWAENKRFHIGDTLRFEYTNDTVLAVDKWGYYHCNTSKPYSVFHDGNTLINLTHPGPFFFASADPNHCNNGQRLMIEVIDPRSRSSPSSAAGSSSKVLLNLVLVAASVCIFN